jgi:ribosomal protein L31
MKPDIHPDYGPATVHCAQNTMVLKAGQVERFKRRYGQRREGS